MRLKVLGKYAKCLSKIIARLTWKRAGATFRQLMSPLRQIRAAPPSGDTTMILSLAMIMLLLVASTDGDDDVSPGAKGRL